MNVNSLSPGGYRFDFICVIFKGIVVIPFLSIQIIIAFMWMVQNPTDDKSTLVQKMACCHKKQAIAWTFFDQHAWYHMTPLGHNEFKYWSELELTKMNHLPWVIIMSRVVKILQRINTTSVEYGNAKYLV